MHGKLRQLNKVTRICTRLLNNHIGHRLIMQSRLVDVLWTSRWKRPMTSPWWTHWAPILFITRLDQAFLNHLILKILKLFNWQIILPHQLSCFSLEPAILFPECLILMVTFRVALGQLEMFNNWIFYIFVNDFFKLLIPMAMTVCCGNFALIKHFLSE